MDEEYKAINEVAVKNKITILIADDHPLWRKALRDVLCKQNDLNVVAEASNGEEAVELAVKLKPKVVLLDIAMPLLNGLEAAKQIRASSPSIAVLVLTVHTESSLVYEILEAGAAGYILKSALDQEIVQSVRTVAMGEAVLSKEILGNVVEDAVINTRNRLKLACGENLTLREFEILKLASQGLNNKEIALKLGLSVGTVRIYFARIFSKLNVCSRTEAVILGIKSGVIDINEPGK